MKAYRAFKGHNLEVAYLGFDLISLFITHKLGTVSSFIYDKTQL